MTPSVVLVTGVSRFLGARLAAALAREPGVARVIGVDVDPPLSTGRAGSGPAGSGLAGSGLAGSATAGAGAVEFVRADIRHPQVARLVVEAEVDTVVHAGVGAGPARDTEVIGTLQLLAACQRSAHLRRLVVRSTVAVYGSTCRDPALFVEADTAGTRPPESPESPEFAEDAEAGPPRPGYARDAVQVEAYVRAFGRRRPDVSVTVLRLANLIGPRMPTPLVRYFGPPAIPTVWGHDPRLQFVHEHDAVEVFRLAALGDRPARTAARPPAGRAPGGSTVDAGQWTVNVAGSGVLVLSQAIRRAGRVALPVPGVAGALLAGLARRTGLAGLGTGFGADLRPDRTGLLTLDAIVDTTRLRRDFGYQPRFTSAQAFDEFVRVQLAPGVPGRPADG